MPNYQFLPATKIIDHYKNSLSGLRSGRVNSSVLEPIYVEFYGSKMKINELATVTIPEPSVILISPFDKSAIPAIVKAITESNLGVNPVDDGVGVRLSFPPLTEENRKKLAKTVSILMEEVRVMIRGNRQDWIKNWKKQKEASEITEDDLKRNETDLQKEVDNLNKEIETIAKAKEQEIMKI